MCIPGISRSSRIDWTFDRWREYLERPGVETWVAWHRGTPAGYVELDAQPDGVVEILEPMVAEVEKLASGECGGRRGDQDLPAVTRCGDPRRHVDVLADVALRREERRPRVAADTQPERARRELPRDLLRRLHRACRGREDEEECVPLRIHLDPVVRAACPPHDTPVRIEGCRVIIGPELAQQPGRALDVREEERDGPGREVRAHRREG